MRLQDLARSTSLVALLALLGADGARGQSAAPCSTPQHRAFDFWEGVWEVRAPDGRVAGQNTIRRLMGGCVLHEHYTTPRGYEGESLNIYDATRDVWHQTWTDNGGLLLVLEGGFDGTRMVLQGETVDSLGSVTLQRITWSRIDGDADRVRQHWEASTDGGATWTTAFDGTYVRRGSGGAPGRGGPGASAPADPAAALDQEAPVVVHLPQVPPEMPDQVRQEEVRRHVPEGRR